LGPYRRNQHRCTIDKSLTPLVNLVNFTRFTRWQQDECSDATCHQHGSLPDVDCAHLCFAVPGISLADQPWTSGPSLWPKSRLAPCHPRALKTRKIAGGSTGFKFIGPLPNRAAVCRYLCVSDIPPCPQHELHSFVTTSEINQIIALHGAPCNN
jgi:hypothetical protein